MSAVSMSIDDLPKPRAGLHRQRHPRSTPSSPRSPAAPSPGSSRWRGCSHGCRSRAASSQKLDRKAIEKQLLDEELPAPVRRALELRLGGAQAAVKKIDALLARAGDDDRVRGAFRYHGAATGRWSGEGFQPQNLKRPARRRSRGGDRRGCDRRLRARAQAVSTAALGRRRLLAAA